MSGRDLQHVGTLLSTTKSAMALRVGSRARCDCARGATLAYRVTCRSFMNCAGICSTDTRRPRHELSATARPGSSGLTNGVPHSCMGMEEEHAPRLRSRNAAGISHHLGRGR